MIPKTEQRNPDSMNLYQMSSEEMARLVIDATVLLYLSYFCTLILPVLPLLPV